MHNAAPGTTKPTASYRSGFNAQSNIFRPSRVIVCEVTPTTCTVNGAKSWGRECDRGIPFSPASPLHQLICCLRRPQSCIASALQWLPTSATHQTAQRCSLKKPSVKHSTPPARRGGAAQRAVPGQRRLVGKLPDAAALLRGCNVGDWCACASPGFRMSRLDMVPCEIRWKRQLTTQDTSLCTRRRSSALSRANEKRLAGAEEEAAAVCRAAAFRCC